MHTIIVKKEWEEYKERRDNSGLYGNFEELELLNFSDGEPASTVAQNILEECSVRSNIEEITMVVESFQRLKQAFKDKTGMTLILNYQDKEADGSRYDEVDEYFFELSYDEVFQETPVMVEARNNGLTYVHGGFVTSG